MTKFAIFIVKHRWWVLAVWLIAAALIVSFSPKLSSVENNDESSFLPKGYESVKAIYVAKKISPQAEDATDIIVFKNSYGGRLTKMDKQTVAKTVANLNAMHLPHVAGVITSPEQIAPNGKIQLATIIYSGSP